MERRPATPLLLATALLSALLLSSVPTIALANGVGDADTTHPSAAASAAKEKPMQFQIPQSLVDEHAELHHELERAIQSGGKTGEAAKAVAAALHPHFVEEEKYALPPLGLLPALANGNVSPDMADVLPLTDKLKHDMPKMLAEHKEIAAALGQLEGAARAENKPEVESFAQALKAHVLAEEHVTYPTAILIGEYVKLKLGK